MRHSVVHSPRSQLRRRLPLFSAATVLLAGCASDADVGRSVLVLSPVWFVAGVAALWPLRVIWRRTRASVDFHAWPHYAILAVLVALAVWSWTIMTPEQRAFSEFDLTALLAFGATSYVTLILAVWRIWFVYRRGAAFTAAHLVVLPFIVLPAIPMAAGRTVDWYGYYSSVAWAGVYGIPTAILFTILAIEALRAARRARPPGDGKNAPAV